MASKVNHKYNNEVSVLYNFNMKKDEKYSDNVSTAQFKLPNPFFFHKNNFIRTRGSFFAQNLRTMSVSAAKNKFRTNDKV